MFWEGNLKNEYNFKIFKNHEGDLSQKSPEPDVWLLFNHTKSKTLCLETNILVAGNYESASGQLQTNSVNAY